MRKRDYNLFIIFELFLFSVIERITLPASVDMNIFSHLNQKRFILELPAESSLPTDCEMLQDLREQHEPLVDGLVHEDLQQHSQDERCFIGFVAPDLEFEELDQPKHGLALKQSHFFEQGLVLALVLLLLDRGVLPKILTKQSPIDEPNHDLKLLLIRCLVCHEGKNVNGLELDVEVLIGAIVLRELPILFIHCFINSRFTKHFSLRVVILFLENLFKREEQLGFDLSLLCL